MKNESKTWVYSGIRRKQARQRLIYCCEVRIRFDKAVSVQCKTKWHPAGAAASAGGVRPQENGGFAWAQWGISGGPAWRYAGGQMGCCVE